MSRGVPAALVCLLLSAFQTAVQANPNHHEELRACGVILRDLPEDLASSFCSSFAAIEDITSTYTSTRSASATASGAALSSATEATNAPKLTSQVSASNPQPRPIQTTPPSTKVAGNSNDARVTVYATSAVVLYFSTTVTVTSTVQLSAKQKRIPAAFCPEVGVPCVMAGMDFDIISEGCSKFVKPKVAHTATKIVDVVLPL